MNHTGMHELMLGMFLGGMLLAAPPVLLGIGLAIYMWRRRTNEKEEAITPNEE